MKSFKNRASLTFVAIKSIKPAKNATERQNCSDLTVLSNYNSKKKN